MEAPRTKSESHDLFVRGAFGNTVRTWETYSQLVTDPTFPLKVTIRYKGGLGGRGPTIYGVEIEKVWNKLQTLIHEEGWDPASFYFNESMPDDFVVIQGELMADWRHPDWYFRGAEGPGHMHDVLKRAKVWEGNAARYKLRSVMDPQSWSDLNWLIDNYDNAIIEFTTFSVCYGDSPGRNTVIWEVRGY